MEESSAFFLSSSPADDEVESMGRRSTHPRVPKPGGWLTARAAGKGASVVVGSDSDAKKGADVEEDKLVAKEEVCCSCSAFKRAQCNASEAPACLSDCA